MPNNLKAIKVKKKWDEQAGANAFNIKSGYKRGSPQEGWDKKQGGSKYIRG